MLAPTARLLRAVRAESGEVVWAFAAKKGRGEYVYSHPAWVGDRVYFGDRAGHLHALDAATGKGVWNVFPSRAANNQINSGPVVHAGVVAVGSNAKLALGFDAATGRERWRHRLDGPCTTTASADGGEMLAWTWKTAYRLRVADGALLGRWHRRHHRVRVAAAAGDITLLVVNREWPVEPYSWPVSQLVAYRGERELYRLDYPMYNVVLLRCDAARGVVYEATFRGLGVFDPVEGERLAVVAAESGDEFTSQAWSPPSAAGGVLYAAVAVHGIGRAEARVVALRLP